MKALICKIGNALRKFFRKRTNIANLIIFIIVLIGAFICMYPLFWMLGTSLKTLTDAYRNPTSIFPGEWTFENYINIWSEAPMLRGLLNSILISVTVVVIGMFTAALAAFAFAKLDFPGKNMAFMFLLVTNMVPFAAIMLPQFVVFKAMGLLNGPLGVIIPKMIGGAITIFFLRQFLYGVPDSVIEAAKLDGAGFFRIFVSIVFPMIAPAVVAQLILNFIGTWNDYLGPMLYIREAEWYTIPLVIANFNKGSSGANNSVTNLMAASLVAMLPILVVFGIFQKQIINSVMTSGSKM